MKGEFNLGSTMNSFYVTMDASLMHTMIIQKKLKGSIREIVELEGPSGIIWHVKMIRSNNTFTLQSGWKDFVTANRIDKDDILVFTYNGNSSFKVVIFDPSGCEKTAPFFAKKTGTETELEESNDSLIRVITAPHRDVKKEIMSLSNGSSDTDESSTDISSRAARTCMTVERVCGMIKQGESTEDESDTGKENRVKKSSRLYVVPWRIHLTKAQEEIANRMARKTQKGSELFVKILAPTNIHTHKGCMLILPDGFACKVLQRKKKKITLLPADFDKGSKICIANYCCKSKRMVRYIGNGWREFARRNGLKQGDLCLFELRNEDKRGILTMVVHFNHK